MPGKLECGGEVFSPQCWNAKYVLASILHCLLLSPNVQLFKTICLTDSTHCESWALCGGLFISDVLETGQPRSVAFGSSFSDLLVAAGLGPAPWGPDLGSPMWFHCLEASHVGQCSVLVNHNSLQLLNKETAQFPFPQSITFY